METNVKGIKLEAMVNVRGEGYTFDCNGLNVEHKMPNAKGVVKVGEVNVEKIQEKITAIVGSVCNSKKAIYTKCNVQDDDYINKVHSNSFQELEYYTNRLQSVLKHPHCKYFVQTQLYAHGLSVAVCDLGVLDIKNKDLLRLDIQDNRVNGMYILSKLLTNLGYDAEGKLSKIVSEIKSVEFCQNRLADRLNESEKELFNVLITMFEEQLKNSENELKELYHILTCSFTSNLVLGIRKHLCDVFELGQLTVKDVRNMKNRVNFYIPKDGKVAPQHTEVALTMRLSVPSSLARGIQVSADGEVTVEMVMYVPVVMPKVLG